jgi:hypothetical protein
METVQKGDRKRRYELWDRMISANSPDGNMETSCNTHSSIRDFLKARCAFISLKWTVESDSTRCEIVSSVDVIQSGMWLMWSTSDLVHSNNHKPWKPSVSCWWFRRLGESDGTNKEIVSFIDVVELRMRLTMPKIRPYAQQQPQAARTSFHLRTVSVAQRKRWCKSQDQSRSLTCSS